MRTTFAALFTLIAANGSSAFAPATFGRAGRSTLLQMAENADSSVFLTSETAKACIDAAGGTPLYAYSLDKLKESADDCLAFPNAYGLTVRYAMKASPNGSILKYFNSRGIHIDASSGFEVGSSFRNIFPIEL